ncbi:MAG TPA: hypothetical protein VG713_02645 [Pirellulales bacterium]|jgi:hypothetical protein|nr:hypothetical protein [Pirellulales bacterium]
MAKATKVNKSAAIREALNANPDKQPKWIAETLTAKGVTVTAQMVSTIKSKVKAGAGKRRGRKPGRPAVTKAATNGRGRTGGDAYDDVQSTIVFVQGVGGLDKAKQLIALLEAARRM